MTGARAAWDWHHGRFATCALRNLALFSQIELLARARVAGVSRPKQA